MNVLPNQVLNFQTDGILIDQSPLPPNLILHQNKAEKPERGEFRLGQEIQTPLVQHLENKNSMIYVQDFQKVMKLDLKIASNMDLNSVNLGKTFGNDDLIQLSLQNMAYGAQTWKYHPLGMGIIIKYLEEFQRERHFVHFCMLAASLLEFDDRRHSDFINQNENSKVKFAMIR